MTFIVYGIGAIGGTIAGRLAHAGHPVSGIARGRQLDALRERGLLLRTPEGEIRTRFPEMPVALATANVQDEVIARARAANVAFVSKPITEEGFRGFLSGAALKLRSARR